MVTYVVFAPRGRQHAPESVVGTAKSSTIWVLGLLAASTAITVAVCVPPPGLHKKAFFLAITCFFFAGVGGVMMSAVCMATTHLHHRDTTWKEVMYVLLAQLASVVGAAFSASTALGVLGLVAASTAITVAVCVPPPALYKNAYFLAISCFFFAGVVGIMSAVCMATTHLRHQGHATWSWRKVMHVLLRAQLVSVVGAAFSITTTLGMLGLAAASTALNLQSMFQPPRGLDESDYYYHLAVSGVFFARVAGVLAAVREGGKNMPCVPFIIAMNLVDQ